MEVSKGSKNQSQIMSYVQCKTYKQRNECAKLIIKQFEYFYLYNKNFIKKTLHPKKKNILSFQKQT
jgi:hypothetical protein